MLYHDRSKVKYLYFSVSGLSFVSVIASESFEKNETNTDIEDNCSSKRNIFAMARSGVEFSNKIPDLMFPKIIDLFFCPHVTDKSVSEPFV